MTQTRGRPWPKEVQQKARAEKIGLIQRNQRERDDNKNKIWGLRGVGLGDREENCPKTLFFVGNATTIKFWKCKFYCREILLSLRRLLEKQVGGGGETQGRGKHTIKPLPKNGFGPPPLMIRFCSRNVILLRGNGDRPGKSHSLRPPKLGLEGALYSTSPPPKKSNGTFCPPPPLRISYWFWFPSLAAWVLLKGWQPCTFRMCTLFFVTSLHCLTLLGARECAHFHSLSIKRGGERRHAREAWGG